VNASQPAATAFVARCRITQTGVTNFSTGTGTVSLNGATTLAANKSLTAAAGTGALDFSLATGAFSTSTGAVSLNGSTTLAANKNFTATAGTGALDFSATSGIFSTGTGAVSLNGDTTLAQGKTLTIAGTNGTASTPITAHYSATASLNFANLSAGGCSTLTVTVTGARVGDTADATPTAIAGGSTTLSVGWNAWVSANDTVTVRECAFAAANAGAETWRVDVWRH